MNDIAPLPALRATRLKSALVLIVTFALGAITGIGLMPLLHRPPMADHKLEALGLRPDQRRRIEQIIARHGPEIDAALGDALPRLRAVQDRVANEINAELDPTQQARFRQLRQRRAPLP
jgi:hypothetical protein